MTLLFPLTLSLSKGCTFLATPNCTREEGQGFDKLSPGGVAMGGKA